ncbi:MAG: glycosyltransferase family 4 protein [Nitrospira sp.]
MRILLVAEVSAERVIGGAERVLREQAVGLAARGHAVHLLTRALDEMSVDEVRVGGATEHRYPVDETDTWSHIRSTIRETVRQLDRMTESGPFDVAIIHQALAGLGPLWLRRRAATEWVYVCHSLAHEEYRTRTQLAVTMIGRIRQGLHAWARRAVEWLVMRRCARVIVLSEFMRQRILSIHGIPADRIVLVPGAADPGIFRPAANRTDARRALGLPTDRTILFTVRNLVPRMGLETLLDALDAVPVIRERCLVVIGGAGPLRATLEAGIRRRGLDRVVQLVGFIPEARLADYYRASDLVVMPTAQLEGFGLVTVEALACGTPVIGTPVGAIPEVLNQIDPVLVSHGADSRALADALSLVLTRLREPGQQDRWSQTGRRLVEQRYNWTRHCTDLLQAASTQPATRKAA